MGLEIVGPHPLASDDQGRAHCRIATLFPAGNMLITLPGIHATQRVEYVATVNRRRAEHGIGPLTPEEESEAWDTAVDLIIDEGLILIRPAPDQMDLAFRADEILQQLAPKHRIRFLYVRNEKVRQAIKHRGECWRINQLAKSTAELTHFIQHSRIAIGGQEIYYYNPSAGIRLLTCATFGQLAALADETLRAHLLEIQHYSARTSRQGNREIGFFMAGPCFSSTNFAEMDFRTMNGPALRAAHSRLYDEFEAAVPDAFRHDDLSVPEWRSQMYAALIGEEEEAISEARLLRLGSEFYMQVQWLPGGRIEDGEVIFDSVFRKRTVDAELEALRDQKCLEILWNYIREYSDVEYINVGRVIGSLSRRPAFYGRRDVYVAVFKQRKHPREIVHIIRMQKWGVREHLDEGRDLLEAIIRSEAYTDYILDRRLACRQLCMHVPPQLTAKKITEEYRGYQNRFHGTMIWSTYFQRDYIAGTATDKIPPYRFQDPAFALAFARLLGQAAAPNLIVGRSDQGGNVLFDDGDEVVLEDEQGLPREIVVADLTGTFADYLSDPRDLAPSYAESVVKRLGMLADPDAFLAAYLDAFEAQFLAIQQEYFRQERAFDTLFRHLDHGQPGSLPDRWRHVLQRLRNADPRALREIIAERVYAGDPRAGTGA
jgi:hypothetical protein